MRYIVLISVFFLSCNGITEPKKTSVDNSDISFTCPDGWSITEEDNLDGQGYYFSIEKSGFDSSGVMTLSYFYNDMNSEELLSLYQEDMVDNVIYKNSDLAFEKKIEDENEHYTVLSSRYTFSLVGLDHHGIISTFKYKGKTFGIIKQGAIEDKEENRKGFEAIERSFTIK